MKKKALKHLGKQTQHAIDTLDVIEWRGAVQTIIELNATEFTSHCPVTKQPDFGSLKIRYSPSKHIVETKSLKLFLWSYRSRAEFNEMIVDDIANRFMADVEPEWLEVTGTFNTRGGISVTATANRYAP